ncbi:MAG TPA: hypothetical protein GX715_06740 [Armatimonadetes bacterium]|jgi:hypothetical protein|nr:hypothetical protein [Armatimonadota bacterium]
MTRERRLPPARKSLCVLLAALLALLVLPTHALCDVAPPEVRELARLFRAQRSPMPSFTEPFTTDLRQWGLLLPIDRHGMVLAGEGGTVPGAERLFVPGLLLRDGALSCRVRLSPGDEGYLMFRASDEADAAYQFVLSTRPGVPPAGFAKKHNLDQLYGGARVGHSYRVPVPSEAWVEVELFFQGPVLLALVGGEPAAYYDHAASREGSLSFYCGARPMALRDLAVHTFHDEEPPSPYGLSRPAPSRSSHTPGETPLLFAPGEGPPLAPRRGRDRLEEPPNQPLAWRRHLSTPDPRAPMAPIGADLPFLAGGIQPASAPEEHARLLGGRYSDPRGDVHVWRLEPDGRFFLDGEELLPLRDTDGLYWAQVPGDLHFQRALRSIADARVPARIRKHGLPWAPVRVRLVDYINATDTDHDFSEDPVLDGRSRILTLAGRSYRVTSARRWLSYFAFTARTDSPMRPHLLIAEAPNDRERYLTVHLQPPDGSGADPNYGIGTGTYTGRGLPCDNRAFNHALLFTPRSEGVRFTISRMPGEERRHATNGAAVSQVFLFALLDLPSERPNPVFPALDAGERALTLAVPSARALLRQCGADLDAPEATRELRAAGYRAFFHYLRFLGFTGVDLGVLDLDEESATPEYTGSHVLKGGVDRQIFSDFLPLAASAGIRVTPVIPPLPLSPQLFAGEAAARRGQAPGRPAIDEWAVINRGGRPGFSGSWPILDLLHPEAAAVALEWAREVAERFLAAGCQEVALRVDGDRGGCIPRAGRRLAEETGYSAADVRRFSCETGIVVPGNTPAERYAWLRENAWDRWLEWRCRTLQSHWLALRDSLRLLRDDSRLILKLAVPDRELARPEAWFEEKRVPRDLIRAHGVDLHAYVDDRSFLLERTLDVAYDRLRACLHRENSAALAAFDLQTEVAELYKGKAPSGVELSFAPWTEHGQHLGSEFFPRRGEHWGVSNMAPWGRWLFRPLTHALRHSNPHRISLSGEVFATAGREHDWRRFARAYRALPAVEPAPFAGKATLVPSGGTPAPTAPLPDDLLVRNYGRRIGIINDSAQARRIELRPRRAPMPGERWVDLATGLTLARGNGQPGVFQLELEPYDLRVLAILPDAPSRAR